MSELYAGRRLVHLVPGAVAGKFDRVSRLRQDTTPIEVPHGIYRGDVLPSNPPPFARWYRATGAAGAGQGEWFTFDPRRDSSAGRWLSDRLIVADFFHEALGSAAIPASAGGGFALKVAAGGVLCSATWGAPLATKLCLVAIDVAHDLTLDGAITAVIGIDGAVASGPAASGGIIAAGAAPTVAENTTRDTVYDDASGDFLTGYIVGNTGTNNVTGGANLRLRGYFRKIAD